MGQTRPQPTRPRREPKQSRSRLLMQSVREATVALLREAGTEAVTTTRIAEKAGISIGSFYQYYPNAEAVLTDIYENILDSLNQELTEKTQREDAGLGRGLRNNIHEGMAITFALHRQLLAIDASFYRAFLQDFSITTARGPNRNTSWEEWAVGWLMTLLQRERHAIRPQAELERAARLMVDVTAGTIQRLASRSPETLSDPRYATELAEVLCHYLLDDPGPHRQAAIERDPPSLL